LDTPPTSQLSEAETVVDYHKKQSMQGICRITYRTIYLHKDCTGPKKCQPSYKDGALTSFLLTLLSHSRHGHAWRGIGNKGSRDDTNNHKNDNGCNNDGDCIPQ
jgi:hypothetical protein